jgi:hypothetical protein
VSLEVPYVRVVVCGEVANGVVDLCAGIDDALRVVREARKVDAILVALELFPPLSFPAVVDMETVVVAPYYGELA